MVRLFIEDIEADVNQDFSNQITYSVDDVKNLGNKTTSFSKTIVLPGTTKNNKLFGNIFEFGNTNSLGLINTYYNSIASGSTFSTLQPAKNVYFDFNASKSAKVRLDVNGLTIIKGVLRLLEIVVNGKNIEYEVALFGELGGFFSKLGASKVQDLDFSEYNHNWNVTNIENSWNNYNAGQGYFYPLIDYGNVSPLNNTNFAKKSFYFTAFRPALFLKQYIDKIITGAGYTYQSNFFNTDYFKRIIIPNNQNRLAYKKTRIFTASPTSTVTVDNLVQMTNQVGGNFTTADYKTWTYTGADTFYGSLTLNIKGTWKILSSSVVGNKVCRFNIYKNGVLEMSEYVVLGTGTTWIGGLSNTNVNVPFNFNYTYTKFTGSFSLATNDTFSIKMESVSGSDGLIATITGSSVTLDGSPTFTPAEYNDTLSISDTLPKGILQKDFFASVVKMFYLMITESKDKDKHLIIEPWIDFYDKTPSSYLNWTNKVDRSSPIKIKPMSEINARYYNLKYKQDSDYYNDKYKKKWAEGYGDRVYDNQMEFAKDSDGIEVLFSATPSVGYVGTGHDKVFPAIYKFNNGTEESTEFVCRILFANKITGVNSWKIQSTSKNPLTGVQIPYGTYTSYGYAGHYNHPFTPTYDLNFGSAKELYYNAGNTSLFGFGTSSNIFNVFYSSYFAEITDKDSRLVTAKLKFYDKDIFNLDFGKLIFIDGVLYRLSKIIDYTPNELCQVELLRVMYLTY